MTIALLAIGYALAVPTCLAILRIARRRIVWAFALLELGTLCIVLGWALYGRPGAAWINAAFAVGFAITWVVAGRTRHTRGL